MGESEAVKHPNEAAKHPNNAETPQLLKKAEELARSIETRKGNFDNPETWNSQQELQNILKRIILQDLDYALDRKVEQTLWNSCFKLLINNLQVKTKDKDPRNKSSAQNSLTSILNNAAGFYIMLLEELKLKFNLIVPFLQSGFPYGTRRDVKLTKVTNMPTRASTNYICQHCLVHLGDIARYRNSMQQAETFYRHATTMAPSSGQPYNQIAILEASRSNKLSTVYFYVRAISLAYPFPAAYTNLSKLLAKLAGLEGTGEDKETKERSERVTAHTFVPIFLRIQGLLHHGSHPGLCVSLSASLSEALTTLMATEALSTWQLLQLQAINIWLWDHTIPETSNLPGDEHGEASQLLSSLSSLSKEEQITLAVVAELQAALLSSMLLPVYSVMRGHSLLNYFALPVLRVLLSWIVLVPGVLQQPGFTGRQLIWPGMANLLNEIEIVMKSVETDNNMEKMDTFPLPEEYDLQAFKPLLPSFSRYNYKLVTGGQAELTDRQELCLLRLHRILEEGHKFTQPPFRKLEKSENGEWRAVTSEETTHSLIDVDKLVKELQEEKGLDMLQEEEDLSVQWENEPEISGKGILKTKNSVQSGGQPGPRYRASRQNVAMAAILNQSSLDQEDDKSENKRVLFRTPSPTAKADVVKADLSKVGGGGNSKQEKSGSNRSAAPQKQNQQPATSLEVTKSGNQGVNVRDLDMTKPPPSLHSNIRPPKLISSPGLVQDNSELGNQESNVISYQNRSSNVQTDQSTNFMPNRPSPFQLDGIAGLQRLDSRENLTGISALTPGGISPLTPGGTSYPSPMIGQFSGLSFQDTSNSISSIHYQQNSSLEPCEPQHQPHPQQQQPVGQHLMVQQDDMRAPPAHSITAGMPGPINTTGGGALNTRIMFGPGASNQIQSTPALPGHIPAAPAPSHVPAAPAPSHVPAAPAAYSLFSGGSPWRGGLVSPDQPTEKNQREEK